MPENEQRGPEGVGPDDLGLGPTQRQADLDRGETLRPGRVPTAREDNLSKEETIRGRKTGDKVFNGRYELKRILGRGGMGVVWLALDKELDHEVALKFLPEVMAYNEAAILELKRETKKALLLTHPHIVRIHGWERDAENAAVSMEYVDGRTLAALKAERENGCLEVTDIREWVQELCGALEYAHSKAKVVHRDLKPQNLMLNGRGELKITDFGISRSLEESVSRTTRGAHGFSGTLAYMSPQQLGSKPSEPADDLYALGATIYELLTGKPPFYGGNIDRQIREETAPSMAQRRRELGVEGGQPIPEEWERVVAACLAKEPGQRPASAKAVWAGLVENHQATKSPKEKQTADRDSNGRGMERTEGDKPERQDPSIPAPVPTREETPGVAALAGGGVGSQPTASRGGKGKWLALAAVLGLAALGGWLWYAKVEQPRRARAAELVRLRGEVEGALARNDLAAADASLAVLQAKAGKSAWAALRAQYHAKLGEREAVARSAAAREAREDLIRQKVDRGQGLGAKLDTIDATWLKAEKSKETKDWPAALEACQQVLAQTKDASMAVQARTDAKSAQALMEQARQGAVDQSASQEARTGWAEAQAAQQSALALFEDGRFGEAKDGFNAAGRKYEAARGTAIERQRERALAEQAHQQALTAQNHAREARAGEDAPGEWVKAEQAMQAATDAQAQAEYAAAKTAFELAATQYALAADGAADRRGDLTIAIAPTTASFEVRDATGRVVRTGTGRSLVNGLAVGRYTVKAKHEDLGVVNRTVEVRGRSQTTATLNLPYGSLQVTSEPGGARVLADGKYLGVTPLRLTPVRPGWMTVRLELAGYKASTLSGNVPDQGTLELADNLTKAGVDTAPLAGLLGQAQPAKASEDNASSTTAPTRLRLFAEKGDGLSSKTANAVLLTGFGFELELDGKVIMTSVLKGFEKTLNTEPGHHQVRARVRRYGLGALAGGSYSSYGTLDVDVAKGQTASVRIYFESDYEPVLKLVK